MTLPSSSNNRSGLSQAFEKAFKSDDFIRFVISDSVKKIQTVENYSDVLAGITFFNADIDFMKNTDLADIIPLESTENPSIFTITSASKQNHTLNLDNITPSRGEIRGPILREELAKLKAANPGLKLYDALAHIINTPKDLALGYFAGVAGRLGIIK